MSHVPLSDDAPRVAAEGAAEASWLPLRGLAVLVVAAVVTVAGWLFVRNATGREYPWMNHDVAFLTYAGFELLHGAKLYVDFDENNPPGSHFLHEGLFAFASAAGVSEFWVTHLFVLGLGVAGVALLRRALSGRDDALGFVLVVLAYGLVIVRGNFSNNIVPSAPGIPIDFGQREQLFALLFLPYVLWRVRASPPTRLALPYLAGLGYLAVFKPYWLVLVGGVELFEIVRARARPAAEYVALGAGMALPYVILLVHSRAAFMRFFDDVVPMILAGGYGHYQMRPEEFLTSAFHLEMLAGAAVVVVLGAACYAARCVEQPVVVLMVGLVAATYASVLHQGKFWSYHAMVLFAEVVVLGAWLVAAAIRRWVAARWRFGVVAVIMTALAASLLVSVKELQVMLDTRPPSGFYLVPFLRGQHKVMFLSTSGDYAYAPLVLRLETVGPWREHFRVPALLAIADPKRRRAALEDYARQVRRRIESERPELLLFSPFRHGLPPGVSLHDVLRPAGVLPESGYARIPDALVTAGNPYMAGWVVYKREGEAMEREQAG